MTGAATSESPALQPDDVRIIRALQIAPRASFVSMAVALGLTESAVNRRYRRLRADGVIRVAGMLNPGALGQSRWLVRLRCRPGSAAAIADALAKRDDVNWVALSAAGCEITCATQSRTREQRENLLGQRLPRTAAVLDINAFAMLRQFVGGRGHYWTALHGVLSPEQEAMLGSDGSPFAEVPVVTRDPVHLTDEDERILDALATDGRASFVDLAAAADSTPGRVSRRLDALLRRRVVHIDVEIAAAALGYHARANLWLRVHPSAVKTVGRTLAQEPEIAFAAAVSGPYNIHAVAHCRDLDELFEFTSDRIGSMAGLQSMEVSPVLQHVKQAGTLLSGDRLVDPSRRRA
ncbi:AsnC family transcriptional regulator [Streptomyces albofaciens JCM 4342]|uniref:Lrp/AsnC family transcriptional regulator n=1 Tax=Streptomyces albofaciens TaxID=66866 RepID=UPI00123C0F24|nr:AsnC family transcriptional regulator [Streptomyces albofaciens]KAA6212314.1 AsnC family transcriptional regulator [Streptomyces albofaciens JCM 4342]